MKLIQIFSDTKEIIIKTYKIQKSNLSIYSLPINRVIISNNSQHNRIFTNDQPQEEISESLYFVIKALC